MPNVRISNVDPGHSDEFEKPEIILTASAEVIQEFNRTWGTSVSYWGNDIALDSLGNIFIAGTSFKSGNSYELLLLKYNRTGDLQWERFWGKTYGDEGYAVAIDSSDDIYLTGFLRSGGGNKDMCVIKYNSSGEELWNRTWGNGNVEEVAGLAIDSSDNVYLSGYTSSFAVGGSDFCLVKYNSSGTQLWNRTWGGQLNDVGKNIALDKSGNIYLTGRSASFGAQNFDICLLKYNSSGDFLWNQTCGGNLDDNGADLALDSANNIYVTGFIETSGPNPREICLVKFNSLSQYQWNQTWGLKSYYNDWGTAIAIDPSDNIYIWGTMGKAVSNDEMILLKYNNLGQYQWNYTWGYGSIDHSGGIILDSLNNIYLSGTTGIQEKSVLIKLNLITQLPPSVFPNGDDDDNDEKGEEEAILGYDMLILLGLICLTIIIIPIKRYKSTRNHRNKK
ncbi:MAG: SBBP repeat-containing protein [Promethearchaeota archaeon]